jgi:hypothetical protein
MKNNIKAYKQSIFITLHNIYYTHIYIYKIRLTEAHYSYK